MPSTSSYKEIKGNNPIYCYLKDDILNTIVNNFFAYSLSNGNNINDIPEDEIQKNISVAPKKKTKKKN